MEKIKRVISLEPMIDRKNEDSWGTLSASTFFINVFLTQNIDNLGLFSDYEFIKKEINSNIVDYSILIEKLSSKGISFPFMLGSETQNMDLLMSDNEKIYHRTINKNVEDYYNFGEVNLSGFTDSKLEDVTTYDNNTPLKLNFDTNKETYINYKDEIINGVNRVISIDNPKKYVIDSKDDINIGTNNQKDGLIYKDFEDGTTEFSFKTQGMNKTNTSLSALTKEEYLIGVVFRPEVQNDVFIDRGATSVIDKHLRLSEIKNLNQLERYGNGFFNLT